MSDTLKPVEAEPASSPEPAPPHQPVRFRTYFVRGGAALRHRNYRLFFTGQLISLVGTWMQNLAQSWLVLTLSHSDPLALGLVAALQFLPILLFSLFTGVLADRYPKRRLLLITQSSAMMLAFILAVLTTTGVVQIWHVYIIAFLLGLVNSFDVPARQAFVSEMVGKEDLMNAVALNSTIFNAARVVGPAIAGLLIGFGGKIFNSTEAGIAFAVWLNAISYIAVIFNLWRMDASKLFDPGGQRKIEESIGKRLKEGLSFIGHHTGILAIMVTIGMVGTFGFNFNVWIPVLASNYLKVDADGYGILMAALGVGALFSAMGLAVVARTPDHRRILTWTVWFGIFEVGVALSGWYWLSMLFMAGVGYSMIQVTAASNTYVQMNTPPQLRGRVMSVYMLVFAGTTPIGSLFVGWLGTQFGTPVSMSIGGILSVLALPLVIVLLWFRDATLNTQ